jgi:hypothetical protein
MILCREGLRQSVRPIETSIDCEAALAHIDAQMGAAAGTPEAEELEVEPPPSRLNAELAHVGLVRSMGARVRVHRQEHAERYEADVVKREP